MFKRSYANVMSTLAVFLVVAGGTAFAASSLAPDSVKSKTVKDNSLKSIDLKDGKAVSTDDVIDGSLTGTDIADASLTGDDVDETTLGQVPDSANLQGRGAASFLSSSVYKAESALGAGTALGDGTFYIDEACDPGDVLLSGGPANVNPTSTMVESFPTPGGTNAWRARINKNAQNDNFSVVVLCIDQA
ncbi:MAG: hypothetical protein QOI10_1726 [Solirubrobacterales bacterium]|nr:hypothetical protein [Solirubrobacterales bacterium]